MTIYRLTLTKTVTSGNESGKEWSNVYHINESGLPGAILKAPAIVDLEKTIYPDNVAIVRWSVTNPLLRGDGQSDNIHVAGTRGTGTPATQLPLFNTVLFKLLTAAGRPSLKYYRLPLDESEVDNSVVDTAVTDDISTSLMVPLLADSSICDESGNDHIGYGFSPRVQNRQLGWHRRTRLGFHRGWVAD